MTNTIVLAWRGIDHMEICVSHSTSILPFLVIYRRTGFKCEHVIIANCDFSPCVQLLERNV